MGIHTERSDSLLILSFHDMRGLRTSVELDTVIHDAMEENISVILIDLASISFISSQVLGSLVTHHNLLKQKQGKIKLVNIQPSVANVFAITRLDRIFEIFADRATAIQSL